MVTPEYNTGKGHFKLLWSKNEHRLLPYAREPFNDPESVSLWRDLGYTNVHFTGEMYDMRNSTPDWFDVSIYERILKWKHLSWSFYKMTPGVILPTHVDTFVRFKSMYSTEPGTICRALVFLEDWKSGHYLDLGNEVMPAWKAGDYVWWTELAPHTASNCGITDRYTLQLTGILSE
jgi:hypothetical protein